MKKSNLWTAELIFKDVVVRQTISQCLIVLKLKKFGKHCIRVIQVFFLLLFWRVCRCCRCTCRPWRGTRRPWWGMAAGPRASRRGLGELPADRDRRWRDRDRSETRNTWKRFPPSCTRQRSWCSSLLADIRNPERKIKC